MFELRNFNKKYPLLTQFVNDKKKMKVLLSDKILSDFYQQEHKMLENFINNLKVVYNDENVKKIVIDIIDNRKFKRLKTISYNLNQYIVWYEHYNKNLEAVKIVDWEFIENKGQRLDKFEIEEVILDLCFTNNYKKAIYINNHDIKEIFKKSNLTIKRKLYSLLQKNNLDFFAFVINELSKYNINIENIDNIFNEEINDGIYNPDIRTNLSEQDFLKLIIYFFDQASRQDKIIINKLIEVKNYELISDILQMKQHYKFSRTVKEDEINKDIFSLDSIDGYQISGIISNILSLKRKFDIEYFENLSYSVNKKVYDKFYEKHQDILELLTKLHYKNFVNLTIDEQKTIYKYIKTLSQEKKNKLTKEVEQINLELRTIYKNEYVNTILESNTIIDKAEIKTVTDSFGKEHNVKIYELKDEQPFTFLITVMHHKVRDKFQNMYGRPAHKLTINDPSNFCKDLKGGSEIISTSMINEKFIDTFLGAEADVMYVFSDLSADDILHICPDDAALSPEIDENIDLFIGKKPMGHREFMIKTMQNNSYNEIAIRRKRKDNTRIMPTAILCYDTINDVSINHAKYFNIPIIVINTKTYKYLQNYTGVKENDIKRKK